MRLLVLLLAVASVLSGCVQPGVGEDPPAEGPDAAREPAVAAGEVGEAVAPGEAANESGEPLPSWRGTWSARIQSGCLEIASVCGSYGNDVSYPVFVLAYNTSDPRIAEAGSFTFAANWTASTSAATTLRFHLTTESDAIFLGEGQSPFLVEIPLDEIRRGAEHRVMVRPIWPNVLQDQEVDVAMGFGALSP